jgi:hypothetical protein
MDLQKKSKQFFEQIKDKPITAAVIDNAARATGYAPELIPVYLAYAEANGINIQRELATLAAAREKAGTEKAEWERRAGIKNAVEKMRERLASLDAVIETALLDDLSESLGALNADAAGLITNAAKINRFPTWADYEAAWEKENDHDFSPALFNRLPFPEGTVSYIGARTGRGKTTVMVNIGIEALFPPGQDVKPRRVLFVSLEESHKQILRRFSLCLAYTNADAESREKLLTVENPYTKKRDPKNTYKSWKRNREIGGPGNAASVAAIIEADRKIKEAVENRAFIYFDGVGASLAEILAAVKAMNRGDIILLDYIQKIKAGKESHSGNPDLERIREGSEKLIEAAKIRECVIIAGAQFNREGYKGGPNKKGDEFTDADFRGCGDLEQDGHNLLGIGRSADKTKTYFGIIKSREWEITDKYYSLDFAGGYSFMSNNGTKFVQAPEKSKGKSKGKTTGEAHSAGETLL